MDYDKFLGYELQTVEEILKNNNVNYICILITDIKHTVMGNDKRVIKIDYTDNLLKIYYALF